MPLPRHLPLPIFWRPAITTTREQLAAQRTGAYEFALAAAEMAANTRADDVVVLDLRGKSPVTEFFVIATGTSPRQMRTVIDELRDLGEKMNFAAWQTSGEESAKWIVLDCVNVVIHVFDNEGRDFYDLELLWGDSPRVDWRKELGLPPATERPREFPSVEDEDDARLEHAHDQDGDPDMDENADLDESVVVEIPDESTGSNSVEFVEIDPPSKRKQRGRVKFPTVVDEEEDTTAEERAVGPMSKLPLSVDSLDEDAEALADAVEEPSRRRGGKLAKPAKKKAVVKKARKPAKKVAAKKPAAKKAVKKPAKKAVKKSVKKAAKKPAPKKSAGKKRVR